MLPIPFPPAALAENAAAYGRDRRPLPPAPCQHPGFPDQWQAQILLRILKKASVIYVSELPDETIRALHMTPAHSLQEALELACERLGNPNASITAIPDGVSVVTTLKE